MNVVRVGIGVILKRDDGKILVGKRINVHAPYYSIFGGKLELGESFEAAAIRELKEELGITIRKPEVVCVTNNLATYDECGLHYISVIMKTDSWLGTPVILEPHKCAELQWVDPHELPMPHFDASELGVKCWLEGTVYAQSPKES